MTTKYNGKTYSWEHIPLKPGVNSIPNLHVLSIDGKEAGLIEKPKDTKTDKSAWRCHVGIGEDCKFIGHQWTIGAARLFVESKLQ